MRFRLPLLTRHSRTGLTWWRVATLGVVLLTIVLSSLDPRLAPPTELDKTGHFVSFVFLALLSRWSLPVGMKAVAVGLLLLGVGIEILQGLTAVGRSADLADIAANVVGIAVGLLIWGGVGLIRRSDRPGA